MRNYRFLFNFMSSFSKKIVYGGEMAHGSSVMRPLSSGIPLLLHTAVGTCDLTVHASPLRDIAPSHQGACSSAYAVLPPGALDFSSRFRYSVAERLAEGL